jgi:lipid II:glycine glycyltransferase (peptidoglycan interpeptide bridge formation enzyme)
MPEVSAIEWDRFLSDHPTAHLLQTSAWGVLKASFGWQVARIIAGPQALASGNQFTSLGAQVLFRRLPLGLSFAYLPRGPVGRADMEGWSALWAEVDEVVRRQRGLFLKVEPDLWENEFPGGQEPPTGFQSSPHSIQPARTLLVDLQGTEDQILARMKQKTRYNIRLAVKRGVIVRPCADLGLFSQLMVETGQRDRFGVHSPDYYRQAYELFNPRGECELLLAEIEGNPLAALMVFAHGPRAWYFYGASSNVQRDHMPTYLLQWEAIRWARQRGCREYDLWGVPDAGEEELEAGFTSRSNGLWGVYRFKRGFGGTLRRSAGPWDRVYNPLLYRLYRRWLGRSGD